MNIPLSVDLNGKVAVITGAGGVLCSGFARAVAGSGAAVALLDINEAAARKAAAQICGDGGKAVAVACDVLDSESLRTAHAQVLDKLGPCSILINGAGGNNPRATTANEVFSKEDLGKVKTFFDIPKESFEFVFNINFIGTVLTTQEFAKDMLDGGDNTIVNISSMNAFRPLTKIPAYSTAKASVSNFTQWLAVHFAPAGIRVNAMAPGFFSTEQTRPLFFNEDGSQTERYQKIIAHTPMGRMGEPEDLWGTLLWLLSREASGFVTGVVVPIDGGFSAYSGV